MAILDRMKGAWNAFMSREEATTDDHSYYQSTYGSLGFGNRSPSSMHRPFYSERAIAASIYNRISIDVASIEIRHIKLDEKGRYLDEVKSALNSALTFEPNLDQGPRAFRQDIVQTLLDKGVAAIVPVDTKTNPNSTEDFDIYSLRVGDIVGWYPKHVRVNLYNENKGTREEITLPKRYVAIVENPLYSVMNEPNSTLQRLSRKLALLDLTDENVGAGKLDLIIQLPYVIKSEARRAQAEQRRSDIEFQLKGSQYGIAYTDGTEKITQLNRPAENQLMKQVEYLVGLLYEQLGVTTDVMNGTADEKVMLNYFNRTIEPLAESIVEGMQRAFLGPIKTADNQRIQYFREPFRLTPTQDIAEIADKFTRNEILSSNEIRGYIGIPPSSDPKADVLQNSNMPSTNSEANT